MSRLAAGVLCALAMLLLLLAACGTNHADEPDCPAANPACNDDDATGGGPPPGTKSCEWVADCVDACTDTACEQACYLEGTDDAQTAFDDWMACIERDCAVDTSPECLRRACSEPTLQCFGSLPGPEPTIGDTLCPDLTACARVCADDNDEDACRERCKRTGTVTAQEHFETLDTCLREHCTGEPLESCGPAACPGAWRACMGPGGEEGLSGEWTCAEIEHCVNDCADNICVQNCIVEGTPEAQEAHRRLRECNLGTCFRNVDQDALPECFATLCFREHAACFDPFETGAER